MKLLLLISIVVFYSSHSSYVPFQEKQLILSFHLSLLPYYFYDSLKQCSSTFQLLSV